ncbi:DNA gyrase subunit B [Campylobacter sp. FMV-PI01]|uniref:DNA gyrase subunit B n=1 Tax=Campylobacter portucalensis TaxID=2608384 RepID=A0A6L5WHP8_9BACT|nr:hypothetical protein [Campylobacter portucalensis]MSN96710.1 DNA gyrase subunit B [Campylobacter portucalensis]
MKRFHLRLVNQILLSIFSVLYPFGIVFKSEFLLEIAFFLALFWGLKAYFDKKYCYFLVSLFFIFIAFFRKFAFFYPVLMNLAMFLVFFISLKNESIITKFAKIKEPNLPQKGVIYTRNLTKIWCLFFIINGLFSFLLFFVNEKFWAIYCGFISYVLVFILFFGEILYRKVFIKID